MSKTYLQIFVVAVLCSLTFAATDFNGVLTLPATQDTTACCLPQQITWTNSQTTNNLQSAKIAYVWPNATYTSANQICQAGSAGTWTSGQNGQYTATSVDNGVTWTDPLGFTHTVNGPTYTVVFRPTSGTTCTATYAFVSDQAQGKSDRSHVVL